MDAQPLQTDILEVDVQTLGQQSTNWLIGRIAWLFGAGLIGLGLFLAWGAEKEVLLHTWEAICQIDSRWPGIESDRLRLRLLDFAAHPSARAPLALPVQATSDGTQSHRRGYSRVCSHYWSLCHLGDWAAIRLGGSGCEQCLFGGCLWSSGYRLGLWPTEYLQ